MVAAAVAAALINCLTATATAAQDHLAQAQSYIFTHDKERE
jgi:hypothetical protein